jgi:hypothetical protein
MQAKMFATGRQWGYFSANDVLELLNRNPIGDEGDVYLSPVNMVPADTLGDEPPSGDGNAPNPLDTTPGRLPDLPNRIPDIQYRRTANVDAIVEAHLPPMTKAYSVLLSMEAGKAEKANKRNKLVEWAEDYYGKYSEQVRDVLGDRIDAFCGSLWAISRSGSMPDAASRMVGSYTVDIVEEHIHRSQDDLAVDNLDATLMIWRTERPDREARSTLNLLQSAMASILDESVAETVTA